MKKLIKVTAKHIKNSKKKPGGFNQHTCPVALALEDAGYPKVKVDGKKATYLKDSFQDEKLMMGCNLWESIPLPKSAQKFVEAYDKKGGKKNSKPFNFYIEVPQKDPKLNMVSFPVLWEI